MTDEPKTCQTCQHYRPGWCTNAIRAQLSKSPRAEVGRDLAALHQNCNGYTEKK